MKRARLQVAVKLKRQTPCVAKSVTRASRLVAFGFDECFIVVPGAWWMVDKGKSRHPSLHINTRRSSEIENEARQMRCGLGLVK